MLSIKNLKLKLLRLCLDNDIDLCELIELISDKEIKRLIEDIEDIGNIVKNGRG
jgi:hypothetical protein